MPDPLGASWQNRALDERSVHVSKRNIVWLAIILAVGALGWLLLGVVWGIVAAVATLAVSEVVERRARAARRATVRDRV